MACADTTSVLGQHASPRDSSPNPPTRPTALPSLERPPPISNGSTKLGLAMRVQPAVTSSAAAIVANVLVVTLFLPARDPIESGSLNIAGLNQPCAGSLFACRSK